MKRLLATGAVFVVPVTAVGEQTKSTWNIFGEAVDGPLKGTSWSRSRISIPSGLPGFPTARGPTWSTVEGRSFTHPVAGAVSWIGHRRIENSGIN